MTAFRILALIALTVACIPLCGCQTTGSGAKIRTEAVKLCGHQPTVAEVNTIVGMLAGPVGVAAAGIANVAEASGCALATSH